MSPNWSPPPAELDALDELWVSAEACFKDFERTHLKVLLPAVNELRYSGRHLLDALAADAQDGPRHFELAKRHALRAKYDAAEARVLMSLESIKTFKEEFRLVVVTDVLPDWVDILVRSEDARKRIGENRALDRRERREEDHALFLRFAGELEKDARRLDVARVELAKKLFEQAQDRRQDARRFLIGVVISVVGLVLAWMALK